MSTSEDAITMVKNAIHNPSDPRHFMRIARPSHTVVATVGGVELACSSRALKVKEVAFDIYDPVIYFPREDVHMECLRRNAKTTHCPLKGDTEYFDAVLDGATVPNVAWSYDRTIDIASEIKDHIAFDARQVQVTEYTAAPPTPAR